MPHPEPARLHPASPYRSAPARRAPAEASPDPCLAGLVLLASASLARVVAAALRGETFGPEPTLALLVLLLSAACAAREIRDRCGGRPPPP